MPLATAAKVEVLRVLVRAGRTARSSLTAEGCDLIVDTCASVAAMGPTLPGDAARATRAAVELFLAHDCPTVHPRLRHDLALAVHDVVRRRSAAEHQHRD